MNAYTLGSTHLRNLPGIPFDGNVTRLFSHIDFVRPFPNCKYWISPGRLLRKPTLVFAVLNQLISVEDSKALNAAPFRSQRPFEVIRLDQIDHHHETRRRGRHRRAENRTVRIPPSTTAIPACPVTPARFWKSGATHCELWSTLVVFGCRTQVIVDFRNSKSCGSGWAVCQWKDR